MRKDAIRRLLAALLMAALLLPAVALAEDFTSQGGGCVFVEGAATAGGTAANKAPAKVSLNKSRLTIEKGQTYQLKAKIPSGTTSGFTWKSSNKKVATVSSKGLVTGVGKGTATITVRTDNGKKASCKVTVKASKSIDLIGYVMDDLDGFKALIRRFKLKQKKGIESSAVYYGNGVLTVMIGDNYCTVIIPAKAGKKYCLDGVNPTMRFNDAAKLLLNKGWEQGYSDSTVAYFDKTIGNTEFSIGLNKKSGGKLASISGGCMGL
jgi:hypothetical protein